MKKANENDDFNDDETPDWKTRTQTKRCYELLLTDGTNKFKAIEKSQLTKISPPLSPGAKFHITGPVKIKNHILLLRDANIRPLGGAFENVENDIDAVF